MSKYSFLKKEKNKGTLLLCTLDTETRGFDGEIFKIGFYDGKNYYCCNNVTDFIKHLENFYSEYDLHLYAHNLDYDFSKIYDTIKKDYKISFNSSLFINNSVKTLLIKDFCTFHDSASLLGFASLEKLSEDFGLGQYGKYNLEEYIKEKGYAIYDKNGEYNKEESQKNFFIKVPNDDEILNYYLKMDCISLYKILEKIKEILDLSDKDLCKIPTTASLAMNYYKKHYPEQYAKATSYKYNNKEMIELENWFRIAYHGGRTEVFNTKLLNGYHYDVVSLFPSRMYLEKFPCGRPRVYTGNMAEIIYNMYKLKKDKEGFIQCKINVPNMYLPPLPYVYENKLCFPTGKLHSVWTLREIEYAESIGCTIESIEQIVVFDLLEDLFSEYVNKFFTIKNTSKGAKKAIAKLLLNTLYGKFGMKRQRETYINIDYIEELKENGIKFVQLDHELGDVLKAIIDLESEYIQVSIASHVTAYSRIYLHQSLQKMLDKGNNLFYCDTDSGVFDKEMEENVGKDLGLWDLENVVLEGIYIQPKLYYEKTLKEEVKKGKGIPNNIRKNYKKETYEEILEMIQGGQDRIELFEGVEKPKKFLSKLKKGEHMNTLLEMRKGINLQNKQKRNMNYVDGTSTPWEIGEYRENLYGYDEDFIYKFNNRDMSNISFIKTLLKNVGYIKIPEEEDEDYTIYKNFLNKYYAHTVHTFYKKRGKLNIYEFIIVTEMSLDCIDEYMQEVDIFG